MKGKRFAIAMATLAFTAVISFIMISNDSPKIASKNVVLSFYFNHKTDPQRNTQIPDLSKYSRAWAESLYNVGATGIIVTNVANDSAVELLKKYRVKVVTISPDEALFVENRDQTTVDFKYFAAIDWIKKHGKEYTNILITDLFDVEVLHDPFPFFEGYDKSVGWPNLYIGSEENGSKDWMRIYWRNCWQVSVPEKYWKRPFYNPGLIGGETAIVLEYLIKIVEQIKLAFRVNQSMSCDMQAAWIATDSFEGRIYTGYPFHTPYKEYTYKEGALLKHK